MFNVKKNDYYEWFIFVNIKDDWGPSPRDDPCRPRPRIGGGPPPAPRRAETLQRWRRSWRGAAGFASRASKRGPGQNAWNCHLRRSWVVVNPMSKRGLQLVKHGEPQEQPLCLQESLALKIGQTINILPTHRNATISVTLGRRSVGSGFACLTWHGAAITHNSTHSRVNQVVEEHFSKLHLCRRCKVRW